MDETVTALSEALMDSSTVHLLHIYGGIFLFLIFLIVLSEVRSRALWRKRQRESRRRLEELLRRPYDTLSKDELWELTILLITDPDRTQCVSSTGNPPERSLPE